METHIKTAACCTSSVPIAVGIPTFESLSFEEAIRLFKQWGFQVEPGPRPEQVTLMLEGPDYRTVSVYDAQMLPEIAATALRMRWQNGALSQGYDHDGTRCEVSLGSGGLALFS